MGIEQYRKYEPFFGSWYFEDSQSKLGSGNFGTVFKVVRHDAKVQPSALKIITIPKEDSEIATRRSEGRNDIDIRKYYQHMVDDIKKEYELMSELKGCSNIVSCEDFMAFRHEDGFGFDIVIRMELLTPLIVYENKKNMDQLEIMKFGIDMCLALERCEIKNIIHRDIKPDNIFISPMGDFKLGDFGIARTMEATNLLLSSRIGTPNYMAPEVYFSRTYDRTVDIYSLGIVLYRMLNNKLLPFLKPQYEKKDAELAFLKRMKGEVLPRPMYGDEALKSIILKACAYNSKERYQHPQEMREDLEMVRSILEYGGTVPEEFAADLDATVAIVNADITSELEHTIMNNIYGQENLQDFKQTENTQNIKKIWENKILFSTVLITIGISIFIGRTIFLKMQNINTINDSTAIITSNDINKRSDTIVNKNIENTNTNKDADINTNIDKNENVKSENKDKKEQESKIENDIKKQEPEVDYLAVTELTGKELKNISEVTRYKNLEILNLAEMEIEEIFFIKELEKLKELNISYTNITDISPLKKCNNLYSLDISYNNENMTEKKIMEILCSMKQLQKLDLTGDMIAGEYEDMLGKLTELTILHIGGTGISYGRFLKKCKKLEELDLQSNVMFTDFKKLTGLKNLEKLNISVTGITSLHGIEKLKKLKELDISMTDITDISVLKELKELESVIVSESQEIKNQIKTLKQTLKNCKFEMV